MLVKDCHRARVPTVAPLLDDDDPEARRARNVALMKLGDVSELPAL